VGGGTIEASFRQAPSEPALEPLLAWVRRSAGAVSSYYGGAFPVKRVDLQINTGAPGRIGGGTTWGGDEPRIRIRVGRDTSPSDLRDDWVLTHEMVHLAFPDMPQPLSWAGEGLATYVEPVARARVGNLSAERVWQDLVRNLPKGLPGPGDPGLDGTRDWGRTYWGGALFWLLADVQIRERTNNRMGLEHALRGIVAAGGSIESRWSIEKTLAEGDRTLGLAVLVPLHARMGPTPMSMELDDLWRRLGVARGGAGVTFDDRAPLASIRRAITAPVGP
jgi:hypothetical protein